LFLQSEVLEADESAEFPPAVSSVPPRLRGRDHEGVAAVLTRLHHQSAALSQNQPQVGENKKNIGVVFIILLNGRSQTRNNLSDI
jgi:hypothetical protein